MEQFLLTLMLLETLTFLVGCHTSPCGFRFNFKVKSEAPVFDGAFGASAGRYRIDIMVSLPGCRATES